MLHILSLIGPHKFSFGRKLNEPLCMLNLINLLETFFDIVVMTGTTALNLNIF